MIGRELFGFGSEISSSSRSQSPKQRALSAVFVGDRLGLEAQRPARRSEAVVAISRDECGQGLESHRHEAGLIFVVLRLEYRL